MSAEELDRFFGWLAENDPELPVVFDVGAHVGRWSLQMAKFYPEAEYHLFEPRLASDPALSRDHAELTAGLHCRSVAKAVGAHPGKADFSVQGEEGLGSSLLISQRRSDNEIVETEIITLDDYAAEQGIERVDFLKMDIQGGELEALKGAKRLLETVRYVFLETWLISSYGQQTPHMFEIFDFLRHYQIFPIEFFSGARTRYGNYAHVDVAYINTKNTFLPKHLYGAFIERFGH